VLWGFGVGGWVGGWVRWPIQILSDMATFEARLRHGLALSME
jgi:hypothetical protein